MPQAQKRTTPRYRLAIPASTGAMLPTTPAPAPEVKLSRQPTTPRQWRYRRQREAQAADMQAWGRSFVAQMRRDLEKQLPPRDPAEIEFSCNRQQAEIDGFADDIRRYGSRSVFWQPNLYGVGTRWEPNGEPIDPDAA